MPGSIAHPPSVRVTPATRTTGALSDRAFWFMSAVVAIQGGHVIEHMIQLVAGVRIRRAGGRSAGLLGYVLQFNGTEEWLHLGYNTSTYSRSTR